MFIRLFKTMLKFWDRLLLQLAATLLVSLTDGISVWILAKLVDILSKHGPASTEYTLSVRQWVLYHAAGNHQIFVLVAVLCGSAILINLIKGPFTYAKIYGTNSLVYKTMTWLRNLIYEKAVRLPVRFFDSHKTGDLTAKITNDVDQLKTSLNATLSILLDGVYGIVFIAYMFLINWRLSLVAGISFPLIALMAKWFSKPIRSANKKIVENVSSIVVFLQETLQSIRVIKIFTREKSSSDHFRRLSRENYSANMKSSRLSAYQRPLNDFLSVIGFIAVAFILGYQTIYQGITIASIVAFMAAVNFAYKPFKNVSGFNDSLQRMLASSQRIYELIDLPDELSDEQKNAVRLKDVKGKVEFRNVTFAYHPGRPVLQKISFKVQPGRTLAIVGPSGSGKSTLVSLIPLFYRDFDGSILLDNRNVRELTLESLREKIAIVPQDTQLFSGTIHENILYGRPSASETEVQDAARHANAHDFIGRLKDGYNTEIGERGVKLSGGEKQRISIARALLKNPPILILDEATSSLDTESEVQVQNALSYLMKHRTTFVIAHRLSTIKHADSILVLDRGRVAETGTHASLYAKNGLYRKLCRMQFRTRK